MKKIWKITGITVLSLLALAFLVPMVFSRQIQAIVKKEINKSLNASVDFSGATLSLFRHFPRATISVRDLSIVGRDTFSKDTLLVTQKMDLTAGLFSVLKGENIKIHGAYFQSPRIRLLRFGDGKANWDILKDTGDPSASGDTSTFRLTLKKYQLSNGYLIYSDQLTQTFTEIKELDHTGHGDLTADVYTLSTSTKAASAYFSQDDIPYLYNTETRVDADIHIDNRSNTYTFQTDKVLLNALELSVGGFVSIPDTQSYKMDIRFSSPVNDFKKMLSMVPAIYKKDFDGLVTGGEASFSGYIKGTWAAEQTPAYDIQLKIDKGSFRYPDLPDSLKNIHLSMRVYNPDGNRDHAVIDVSKGHLEIDNEPFDFHFLYRNPVTIQYIDAGARGRMDLSQLSRFMKLDEGTRISGQVLADAFVKGPMKALQARQGAFTAGGFFDISNLLYQDKNFPQTLQNGRIRATLANEGGIADQTVIDISSGYIELGKDPVDFSLQLKNPITALHFSGKAKGRFNLANLKQFTTLPAGTSISGMLNADMGFAGNKTAIDQKDFDKIKLDGRAGLSDFLYRSAGYPGGFGVSSSEMLFQSKNVLLKSLSGRYLSTSFSANGTLNNLLGFLLQDQALAGGLSFHAGELDLNEWIGSQTGDTVVSASGGSGAFQVPDQADFTIRTSIDRIRYNQVDYLHTSGTVAIKDEKISFRDLKSQALDGTIRINGSYSTRVNKQNPDISLTYDVEDMNVQKAFLAYNTIQFLMPIGKYLSGTLQSELSMVGNLNGKMMPVLNSLTGKGNLLLLRGVLARFSPLEKIASLLDIDRLKSISVKDIKNYIEFKNGMVMVKPFTVKVDEIVMQIGGRHGFDQSLDYIVGMKLPRKYLGQAGNQLINGLVSQATGRGIPLKTSEVIDLNIKVNGTLSNPSVKIDLEQVVGNVADDLKEQALDFARQKIDSLRGKDKDTSGGTGSSVKDSLKQKIKDQIFGSDTTVNKITPDSSKKKAIIKKALKDIINRNNKSRPDSNQQE